MPSLSPQRALFLHGADLRQVRAARRPGWTAAGVREGFSLRTIAWAFDQADAPRRAQSRADALDALPELGPAHPRASQPVAPDMPDSVLRDIAKWRAALMLHLIGELAVPVSLGWLAETLAGLQGKLPPVKCAASRTELEGCVKRACCHLWWRRQLRRWAGQAREARAAAAGRLGKGKQVYCTDDTAKRHAARVAANRAMLEHTEIEDENGQVITLAAAVDKSVADKSIRRGELMTRMRGAEEWAEARKMVGVFTTNTAPSRFHPAGGTNPRFDGSTPADAQRWLCKTWARARAAMARARVTVFGIRVAEPHQDGCPHWHMMLWAEPAQLQKAQDIIRAHWLAEELAEAARRQKRWACMGTGKRADGQPLFINPCLFDGGLNLDAIERGATDYRVNFKPMEKGKAAGYIAKYIAKGIDDHGAVGEEGHRDDEGGGQVDAIGGNAKRVEAWASEHRIRQFQAIGQPPVTVWRELRRVSEPAAQSASPAVQEAREAVNRDGGRRACWRRYMEAQGGAMTGRDYRIELAGVEEVRRGRYGEVQGVRILGVRDRKAGPRVVESERKAWKPRGCWGQGEQEAVRVRVAWGSASAKRAQPWTRVNNCTHQGGGIAALMGAGIVGATMNWDAGGQTSKEEPPPWQRPPNSASTRPPA